MSALAFLVFRGLRKMQCLGSFVANLAKKDRGYEVTENQRSDFYPSFIVRLSFVIGSFKVGKR